MSQHDSNGWKEFTEQVNILERRSLDVRKIRELSNQSLYDLAAKNVAVLHNEFPNEYSRISSQRSEIHLEECGVCMDNPSIYSLCKENHKSCEKCLQNLYARDFTCPFCRGDLLCPIPYGPTRIFHKSSDNHTTRLIPN